MVSMEKRDVQLRGDETLEELYELIRSTRNPPGDLFDAYSQAYRRAVESRSGNGRETEQAPDEAAKTPA